MIAEMRYLFPREFAKFESAIREDERKKCAERATPMPVVGMSPNDDGSVELDLSEGLWLTWHLGDTERAPAIGDIVRVIPPRVIAILDAEKPREETEGQF